MTRSPLLLLLILATAGTARASDHQSLDTIRAAAHDYVESRLADIAGRVEVETSALDSRLKLTACERPLEAFLPSGRVAPGNLTVGVRCSGAQPWSLYVPVQVKLMRPVAVLVRTLTRGAIIDRDDFTLKEQDTASLRAGFIDDPELLVGMRLKHSLSAGSVISNRHLDRPSVVRRGDRVVLEAGARGFIVRMQGKALEDAAAGDRVRVENLSSSRVVEGRVTSDGRVRIQL